MSTNIRDKAIISLASAMVSLSVFSQSTDQNYLMETTMLDANSTNVIRSVQYYNGLGYPTVSAYHGVGSLLCKAAERSACDHF